ncbi:hypothetical protein [uncultured Methanolobus sp.]|uniref:hypothetical protein n=1 Tax=uncultured Methanolobus sp. TaxID=218300 RepID=UPI0029C6FE33|nr:hypothetical protein [uncultured Methanolobus sp.]
MEIEIIRGYEILPNNNVMFGIRITNNTDLVISDVQVILDYNESLFKLQGDRIQKLGSIPPTVPRTAKFIMMPLGCVHKENIEATVTYRDHRWKKHIVTMRPKDIHCVCPFLRPKPMNMGEFLHLSGNGYSIEDGINLQGIGSGEIITFLRQTCNTRLYTVDSYSIDQAMVLYFSGESVGEKAHYLLTALIKENAGMTYVMFRAVSDKPHGINGFLNEIVSELKHLINTVNSAKEIGIIKHEQVINIIDSVVQRSNIINGTDAPSINIKDSVVQRTGIHTPSPVSSNPDDVVVRTMNATPGKGEEEEISDMYSAYLEEIKAKHAQAEKVKRENPAIQNQSRSRQQAQSERGSLYASLRLDESAVKKNRFNKKLVMKLTVVAVLFLTYLWAAPLMESDIINMDITASVESYIVESRVRGFLNAVNEGDTGTAFDMYRGSDFLAPASITIIFGNNGIEAGSIKDINIISNEIAYGQAVLETNCTVSSQDQVNMDSEVSSIPIYFKLEKMDKGWILTRVSFNAPLTIEYDEAYIASSLGQEGTAGKLAVQTVSSNLMVKNIEGLRAKNSATDMSGTIDLLKLQVGLNVGSNPVDMNDVIISVSDGKCTNVLVYAGNKQSGSVMKGFSTSSAYQNLRQLLIEAGNPEKYYTVDKIRDEDASFSQENPVMNTGDLMIIYIATTSSSSTGYSYMGTMSTSGLEYSGLNIAPRTGVSIVLTPESGATTEAFFGAPSSYGTRENVQLYP